MKLRRVGNATGLALRKDILEASGLAEGDEVEVVAGPGEIRIMKASGEVLLPVTDGDLPELAKGRVTKTAHTMARKVIRERK